MDDTVSVGVVATPSLSTERLEKIIQEDPGLYLTGVVETVARLGPATGVQVALLDPRLADGTALQDNIISLTSHRVAVLVVSGGEDRELIEIAARAGASGLVRRTADPSRVVAAIKFVAAGHDYVTADWAAAIDAHLALAQVPLSKDQEEILTSLASGETASSVAKRSGMTINRVAGAVTLLRQQLVSPPASSESLGHET